MGRLSHSIIAGPDSGQVPLSNLLFELSWEHGWEALAEAMEAVWEITGAMTTSVALGGKGPYDLLLYPRRPFSSRCSPTWIRGSAWKR